MGKITIGFLAMVISGSVSSAFGQTPTVTNADLEKYKEKRLAAQKELNENFEELGFPSPEERLEAEARSRQERARIVADLRRRDAERARREYEAYLYDDGRAEAFPYPNPSFVDYGGRYAPSYFYYRFYDPRYPRYGKRYRAEPPRFRTLRRMLRNATRGVPGRLPGRRH